MISEDLKSRCQPRPPAFYAVTPLLPESQDTRLPEKQTGVHRTGVQPAGGLSMMETTAYGALHGNMFGVGARHGRRDPG